MKTMSELISADCHDGEHGLEIELTSATHPNGLAATALPD